MLSFESIRIEWCLMSTAICTEKILRMEFDHNLNEIHDTDVIVFGASTFKGKARLVSNMYCNMYIVC